MMIDEFIGDDTGAPLQSIALALVTDDGYRVEFWAGSDRNAKWSARVSKID